MSGHKTPSHPHGCLFRLFFFSSRRRHTRFKCDWSSDVCSSDLGPVNTVDKIQTIHQVVVQGKERVVSLHVYSRPIESCVAFDLEKRTCYRRTLSFHSRYGQVVLNEGDVATNPIAQTAARG